MALKALLFDVDGTLADTERDGHRPAFNLAFQEMGLNWHWDEVLYGELLAVTGGKERIRYYVDKFLPEDLKPAHLDTLIAALHRAKTRHYTALLEQGHIPLRPGVRRLIDAARTAGMRLAIATTTTPENVTALLDSSLRVGAANWFEVIAAGDIVPAKKPASDIYVWVLQALGLEPGDCLAFEDSEHGLRASLGAGIPTVITVNNYTQGQNFEGATVVLSDLGEPGAPGRVLQGTLEREVVVDLPMLAAWSGR